MSSNAQGTVGVGTAVLAQEIGEVLSAMQVGVRGEPFPRALNGGAESPADPRAARVRSEMQREGGSPHWEGIFALALCDVAHPATDVARVRALFVRALAEIDEAIARRHRARPVGDFVRPLSVVVATALKAEHRLELAELRAVESPTSVKALQEIVSEADRCMAHEATLRAFAERTLIVERSAPREVVGRRSGALSLA